MKKTLLEFLRDSLIGEVIKVYHVHVLRNGRPMHEAFVSSLNEYQVQFFADNGVVEVLERGIVDMKIVPGTYDEPDMYMLVLNTPIIDLNGTGRETITVDISDSLDLVR